jgi:hypothetical protein
MQQLRLRQQKHDSSRNPFAAASGASKFSIQQLPQLPQHQQPSEQPPEQPPTQQQGQQQGPQQGQQQGQQAEDFSSQPAMSAGSPNPFLSASTRPALPQQEQQQGQQTGGINSSQPFVSAGTHNPFLSVSTRAFPPASDAVSSRRASGERQPAAGQGLGSSGKEASLLAAGWNPFLTATACGFPLPLTADSASSSTRRGSVEDPPPGQQQLHRQQGQGQQQQGQQQGQAVLDSNSTLVSVGGGGAATTSSSDGSGSSGRRFAALLRRFRAAGRGASSSGSSRPPQGHAGLPLPPGAACSEDGSRSSPYMLSVCESTSQTESISPRKLTSPGDRSGVAWMSASAEPAPWASREAQL